MSKKIITILFLPIILFSQGVKIQISIFSEKATLQEIQGEKLIFIDSLSVNNDVISYNKILTYGLYRITFAQNKWLNFIYDGNDIRIKTDFNNIPTSLVGKLDSLRIIESESN